MAYTHTNPINIVYGLQVADVIKLPDKGSLPVFQDKDGAQYIPLSNIAIALAYTGFQDTSILGIALRLAKIQIIKGGRGRLIQCKDLVPFLEKTIEITDPNAQSKIGVCSFREGRYKLAKQLLDIIKKQDAQTPKADTTKQLQQIQAQDDKRLITLPLDIEDEYCDHVTANFSCPNYLLDELDALANALGYEAEELLIAAIKDLVNQHKSDIELYRQNGIPQRRQ